MQGVSTLKITSLLGCELNFNDFGENDSDGATEIEVGLLAMYS